MVKNVLNTLRKKQKNNKGFSLVELIVVIAIMAVLVGVLAPQFIKYVERSRQSTDLQNVEELKNAVEVEAADNGITQDAVIEIKNESNKFKAELNITTDSLSKKTVELKSKGWTAGAKFTYNKDTLKWTHSGKTTNSKEPGRDLADVFSSSETNQGQGQGQGQGN